MGLGFSPRAAHPIKNNSSIGGMFSGDLHMLQNYEFSFLNDIVKLSTHMLYVTLLGGRIVLFQLAQ